MKLTYIGPKPIVTQHGITFDKSEPDRFVFLHAAIEIIEVLEDCVKDSSCSIKDGIVDLSHWDGMKFSDDEIQELVKKHCDNIEQIIDKREERLQQLLKELKENVNTASTLTSDEKEAWLGNIEIMKDYYMQFIENELAYECMLDVLIRDIKKRNIKEIIFALYRNYGFVFSYLKEMLINTSKYPLDAELKIETKDNKLVGRFLIKYPNNM